jgi:hypothetical protein
VRRLLGHPNPLIWRKRMNWVCDFESRAVDASLGPIRLEGFRTTGAARRFAAAVFGAAATLSVGGSAWAEDLPEAIRAPGETVQFEVHAEGAQIYECKGDAAGMLAWVFREPIASLFRDGKTVGRHFAGPEWEFSDGGSVLGKVEAKAPGAGPADIPWLKLGASSQNGQGAVAGVTTIQRIHTHGGGLGGSCETAGAFRSVPYSADYVFLKK